MSAQASRTSGEFVIRNRLGLHARAAALVVQLANRFRCEIRVRRGDLEVNGKSIMGLMLMAAGKGARITIEASGDDAHEALEELGKLIDAGFHED